MLIAISSSLRYRVLVSVAREIFVARQQLRQLRLAESKQVHVEVFRRERPQFDPQQIRVPAGVERQLVIGDHQCPSLRLREVPEHNDRNLRKP